jgi:hypothetical protein
MSYVVPAKRIISKEHLDEFIESKAYADYIGYIERLNGSIANMKIDSDIEVSKVTLTPFAHLYIHLLMRFNVECTAYLKLA